MKLAKKKRFWNTVDVAEAESGFVIQLDGRTVKTPEKRDLLLPTRKAAELVAQEWDDTSGELDPTAMPATRWANVSVDKMGGQMAAVVDMLAAYGENDLLCYRATHPQELIARQAAFWDAPLQWASQTFEAPLLVTSGVIPVEQPNQSVANLRQAVETFDPFELAAFHDLVQISGSLVLALAVARQHMVAEQAWDVARVDENWQIEHWGVDDEAAEAAELKRQAFLLSEELLLSVRKTLH
ncbi:ATP12 family chaperone protein [Neptunicoccus cionae]|uniref:ATP12 family chaperone protein n=1 Tax=Neptunicoccus cionae TaxID=2035344 RepID=UPI000C75B412|nr:ATP12 family protein [Amylibacter cionae]PLS19933.1 ATPase [Amylibacter cionae]